MSEKNDATPDPDCRSLANGTLVHYDRGDGFSLPPIGANRMTSPADLVRQTTAKVRCRLPLLRQWSIPVTLPNGVFFIATVHVEPRRTWVLLPGSSGRDWASLPFGPFVIALRFDC
jgi:hypothetical protein